MSRRRCLLAVVLVLSEAYIAPIELLLRRGGSRAVTQTLEKKSDAEPILRRVLSRYTAEKNVAAGGGGGGLRGEVESLSVVASSVMALGVLPGSELKTMLDGVAESLPPEVFKGLITSVGETLSPQQHKALLTNVSPRLLVFALGNWTSPARRESAKSLVKSLVPRRLAKLAVNRWVRGAEPEELKLTLRNGLEAVPVEALERLAPVCIEAIFGARQAIPVKINVTEEEEVTTVARLSAEVLTLELAAVLWPRLLLAMPSRLERMRAVERFIADLTDTEAPAVLQGVCASGIINAEEAVPLLVEMVRTEALEAELSRILPIRLKSALIRDATSQEVSEERWIDTFMAILGSKSVEATRIAFHASRLKLDRQTMLAACAALSTARYSTSKNTPAISPWIVNAMVSLAGMGHKTRLQRLFDRWQREFSQKAFPVCKSVIEENAIEVVVKETVETLPPALVGSQLGALLERLPPEFVRDEAVAVLGSLEAEEALKIAEDLIENAPEEALRSLARKLLDKAAETATGTTATTLTSLSIAACSYDVELLRRTAKTLLGGAGPRLATRAQEIVARADPAKLRQGALEALNTATERSRKFDSLKSMLASSKPQTRKQEEPAKTSAGKTLFSALRRRGKKQDDSVPLENGTTTLEARLLAALRELPPDFLGATALDTLAGLPPVAFESASRLLVLAAWDRLVLRSLPPPISEGLKEAVALFSDAYNGTLIASNGLSAAGGVAGGAAIQSAFTAVFVSVGQALLAAKTTIASTFAVKGAVLTTFIYASRVAMQQHDPADDGWTLVAEDAALACSLFTAASLARLFAENQLTSPSNTAKRKDAADRSKRALRLLLLTDDLDGTLRRAARPRRKFRLPPNAASAVARSLREDCVSKMTDTEARRFLQGIQMKHEQIVKEETAKILPVEYS